MSSQYVELANRPQPLVDRTLLTAEIGWRVWGTPANFNGLRVLASLLHPNRSTKVNQTALWLAVCWADTRKIHFESKSCVLLYWQRYCTAIEQWAWAKLCGVIPSRDRAAIPFDIGRLNCLVLLGLLYCCLLHARCISVIQKRPKLLQQTAFFYLLLVISNLYSPGGDFCPARGVLCDSQQIHGSINHC